MIKRFVLSLLLGGVALTPLTHAAEFHHHYPAKLIRIKDADTMVLELNLGLGIEMTVDVRIKDYEAPETWRMKNLAHLKHGEDATAFAAGLLPKTFLVRSYGWAVFNRVEVDILLGDQNYADIMVANGFEKNTYYPPNPE